MSGNGDYALTPVIGVVKMLQTLNIDKRMNLAFVVLSKTDDIDQIFTEIDKHASHYFSLPSAVKSVSHSGREISSSLETIPP